MSGSGDRPGCSRRRERRRVHRPALRRYGSSPGSREHVLRPGGRERKARLQDDDGLWIGGEHGFCELLLLERQGLAVDGLFAVAGQWTLGPPGIAGWMIADDDYRDVGFTCQISGGRRVGDG